jgi:branched-chain amino acid transport system substrate-binding protein
MNKSSKTVWLIIAALVVVGLIWWGASRNGASGNVIKIGLIAPMTGDAAAYGEPIQRVVQLAADEINAGGGINGKQIQILTQDGKCNGTDAANAAQELININNVQIIIGGFCSGESLAAVPIAESNKVLLFSPSASSPKLTGISHYFVRDYPSDSAQGKVLADAAYNLKHWKTVAFIQEQTDYAEGIYNAFESEFSSLGGKTINESFPSDTTDFRSMLTKLRSQNPNALFIGTQAPAGTDRILKQLQELGWKPPLLVNDIVPGDPPTLKADAVALEGALCAEFGVDPTNAKFEHLLQAYQAKYNEVLPYQSYAQTAYDEVYILRDGIAAVGYNGSALADWVRTVKDWPGASGSITIQSNGDLVGGHRLEMIYNGVAQPVKQ